MASSSGKNGKTPQRNPPGNPEWRDDNPDPLTQDVPRIPAEHYPGRPMFGKDRRSLRPAPVRTAKIKARLAKENEDARPCPWCKGPIDMNLFTDEQLRRERARRNGRKGARVKRENGTGGMVEGEDGVLRKVGIPWLTHKEGCSRCRCPGCSESREIKRARDLEKRVARMERRKARLAKRLKELEEVRVRQQEKARKAEERRRVREEKARGGEICTHSPAKTTP